MPRQPRHCPTDWPVPPHVLRELIEYNPETGVMTWHERPSKFFKQDRQRTAERNASNWNAKNAGKPALACNSHGYLGGRLFDRTVKAHRVAWAIYYGEWPAQAIDHINGDRSDNRISNLRDVTIAENNRNETLRRNNKSGVTGVSWEKLRGKWQARIRNKCVGYFDDKNDAIAARKAAEAVYGFHPNHGRAK